MGIYSKADSQAIQDRARVFVEDRRVGGLSGGALTFLQKHRNRMRYELRNQNHGHGLTDGQLTSMKTVSQIYEAVVGLNRGYSEDFLQRVKTYLEAAHEVIDGIGSKNRSFLNKRSTARTRKNVVLDGEQYFWNAHLDPTSRLVEMVCRLRSGEPEGSVWTTLDPKLYDRIRDGQLDAGELHGLLDQGRYLSARTFISLGPDGL